MTPKGDGPAGSFGIPWKEDIVSHKGTATEEPKYGLTFGDVPVKAVSVSSCSQNDK